MKPNALDLKRTIMLIISSPVTYLGNLYISCCMCSPIRISYPDLILYTRYKHMEISIIEYSINNVGSIIMLHECEFWVNTFRVL